MYKCIDLNHHLPTVAAKLQIVKFCWTSLAQLALCYRASLHIYLSFLKDQMNQIKLLIHQLNAETLIFFSKIIW